MSRYRNTDEPDVKKGRLNKSGLKNALKLYKYIKPYRGEYALGTLFLIGSTLTSLAFPKLLGDLVGAANNESVTLDINQISLILVAVLILQAICSFFRVKLFVNVTEKTLSSLRQATYNHLIKLPIRFFEQRRVGELNSRISADTTMLQDTLTTTLAELLRQIITVIGGITLLALTSVELTLFMLMVIPPMVLLVRFFGKYIRSLAKEAQQQVAESNTIVEETLQGIQSVKVFTNEAFEMFRYKNMVEKVAETGMRRGTYRGAFSSFIIVSIYGSLAAVIWRGAILLSEGTLMASDLFTFTIYSVFVGGTIGGLANVIASIQKFIGATEDLFELFDESSEEITDEHPIVINHHIKGEIVFNKLQFAYPARPNENVLKEIDLNISTNQRVALVGSSGAGKSTIATLLLRLHAPTNGQILFDGVDYTSIALSQMRAQIALVPQDIFLFGGTIKENIAYGKPDASELDILEAAKNANAMEFIRNFPEGIETVVGERGTQLSGGQRQRIAIARALLKNPRILILDEATSALDSESESVVQEALDFLMKGRTSIIIAHRLSTVRHADKIVVLDKGQIAEVGTHEELITNKSGIYTRLSKLQFAN